MDVKELKAQYEELESKMTSVLQTVNDLEADKIKLMKATTFGQSDERKLLGAFNCRSVKELLECNTAHPRFGHIPTQVKYAVQELKKEIDIARWIAQMRYGGTLDVGEVDKPVLVKNIFNTDYAKERDLENRLKAFDTTTNADWVGTVTSSQYIEEYELARDLRKLMQEIPMPHSPFDLPVVSSHTEARSVGEGAAGTSSSFSTSKLTFEAKKLFELYELPEEINEESMPPILSIARMQLVAAHERAVEQALINGDDTATHMDTDTAAGAANLAAKIWKGLRKRALANTANGSVVDVGGALSLTKIDEIIAAAGKFGVNPRESGFLVSAQGYNQLVALDETTTVDQAGSLATLFTGALAGIRGRGIMVSEYMRDDLDATGVNSATPANNVKSAIILFNKTRFYIGKRRPIRMRVGFDPRGEYDRWQLAAYQRLAFTGHAQGAVEKSAIIGVNITV